MLETELSIEKIEDEIMSHKSEKMIESKQEIKINNVTIAMDIIANNFRKIKIFNLEGIDKDMVKKKIKITLKNSVMVLFIASFIGVLVYSFLVVRVLNAEKSKGIILRSIVNKQNAEIASYQTEVTGLKTNLISLKSDTDKLGKNFTILLSKSAKLDKVKKTVIPK